MSFTSENLFTSVMVISYDSANLPHVDALVTCKTLVRADVCEMARRECQDGRMNGTFGSMGDSTRRE